MNFQWTVSGNIDLKCLERISWVLWHTMIIRGLIFVIRCNVESLFMQLDKGNYYQLSEKQQLSCWVFRNGIPAPLAFEYFAIGIRNGFLCDWPKFGITDAMKAAVGDVILKYENMFMTSSTVMELRFKFELIHFF